MLIGPAPAQVTGEPPVGGGPVGGVDQAMGHHRLVEARLRGPARRHGVEEGPVGLDVGADGQTDVVVTEGQVAHPSRRRAGADLGALRRLHVERPEEVVVEPRHALAAEHLDPASRAAAQDVVPHAHELGRCSRRELQSHGGQVLDALVAGEIGGAPRHLGHLSQAEAQDVDVMDGVLDQASSAGHGHVAAPRRAVQALDREVLVVAKDRRHGRAELVRGEQVPQGPEHRGGAQHQADLGGHAGTGDHVGQCLGAGQVGCEGLLAEHRAPRGHGGLDGGAVGGGRRAHPHGVHAFEHLVHARRPPRHRAPPRTPRRVPGRGRARPRSRRRAPPRGSWPAGRARAPRR